MRTLVFLLLLFLAACRGETAEKVDRSSQQVLAEVEAHPDLRTPDETLGELFREVQLQQVFEDGKTFVDARALHPYDSILAWYESSKDSAGFSLEAFVQRHFEMPPMISSDFQPDLSRSATEHIEALWPVLTRKADPDEERATLIPLPEPYVVPGGRFREVYYWDSYFTMLGLLESGEDALVASMLANFDHLVETVGHIPNGNRTYYISRSQPPFFGLMIDLLADEKGAAVLNKHRDALRKEYEFWMAGSELLEDDPIARVVPLRTGVVNRYYDLRDTPRQESYREDYELVEQSGGGARQYRDLRAGAESGWDFSTRWFEDVANLATIETTDIIPVDLNALLYATEEVLLGAFSDDEAFTEELQLRMEQRKAFLDTFSWDPKTGAFRDYDWVEGKPTPVISLAMAYPLFVGMASQEQADAVAKTLETDFLKPGGVVSTLNHSGQQWDAPNGWAPLQWITVQGLHRYGHTPLAREIASRWVSLNEKVYRDTGKFVEKYNVEDLSLEAGGGEYPVQDGFGWSNGVYLALKAFLQKTNPGT